VASKVLLAKITLESHGRGLWPFGAPLSLGRLGEADDGPRLGHGLRQREPGDVLYDIGDILVMIVETMLMLGDQGGKAAVFGKEAAQSYEDAHDRDINLDCSLAAQKP